MMTYKPKHSARVASHAALVATVIPDFPVDVVLALIHVESSGDPNARRPGSQFCGLLQMGRMAGIDVGFRDVGADTTTPLLGDAEYALRKFRQYQQRYADRVGGEPDFVALLWKGGPGYVRNVRALMGVPGHEDFDACVRQVGKRLGFDATEYIRRFRLCREVYGGGKV